MKKNQQYGINFATNTIIVTKVFMEEASQLGTDAFQKMMELRSLNIPIAVRVIKRKSDKRWSYRQMENYISCVEDSEKYFEDYRTVKKAFGYLKTWKWFRRTFPNHATSYEMNENHKLIVTPADYPKDDTTISNDEAAA